MKKLFIIASLILALPYVLFPAANQTVEVIPQAPKLPPLMPQPVYVPSSNDLSNEDYFFYMELTKKISPEMYSYFLRAEKIWGKRCFKAAKKDASQKLENQSIVIKKPTYSSNGYPFFVIHEDLKANQTAFEQKLKDAFYMWQNPSAQEKSLNTLSPTLTDEEKKLVAKIIEDLTPELYKLLKEIPIDTYVKGGYAFAAVNRDANAYPVIKVNKNFFNFCYKEQLFFIGHELGHYAILDIKEVPIENSIKYNRHDSSYLEGTANRLLEHECDRFSILVLKTSAKAAIDWAQRCIKEKGEFTDLNKTHPSYTHRIHHFINLEREPRLNDPKKEPDWNTIRDYYRQN